MNVTIKGGIYKASSCHIYEQPGTIKFFDGSNGNFGEWIFIGDHIIECEVEDIDTTQIEIDALREKIVELKTDCEMKVNIIEQKISSLLCIENKPSSEIEDGESNDIPF